MKEQQKAVILERMRRAILEQEYVMTPHAIFEMREDHLDVVDVESAVLTGRIERVFTDDPRGPRFEVVGKACDEFTEIGVVGRLVGAFLIITVYERK